MMAFVIIGADIDLSVASVMGLAACVMAFTFQQGAPLPLAIALALASGVLAGLNNAFWIAYVGLPSLAVTLAGLIGYRGVARDPGRGSRDRRTFRSGSTRSVSRR